MSLKTTAVRWVSHQNKDFAKDGVLHALKACGVRRCDQIPAGAQTPAAL